MLVCEASGLGGHLHIRVDDIKGLQKEKQPCGNLRWDRVGVHLMPYENHPALEIGILISEICQNLCEKWGVKQ